MMRKFGRLRIAAIVVSIMLHGVIWIVRFADPLAWQNEATEFVPEEVSPEPDAAWERIVSSGEGVIGRRDDENSESSKMGVIEAEYTQESYFVVISCDWFSLAVMLSLIVHIGLILLMKGEKREGVS